MVSKQAKNVAEFSFSELCEQAKGSPDYMAITAHYNSIIIRGVPRFSLERRDLLRRFILLIDEFYYQQKQVIIEAETSLEDLFEEPETKSQFDE
mmetsp:Transcript_33033/g.32170  ORF Transcript_33033/g.32170 Transcript_33033/m.32170 type:complete len:94 (+) Transcript_33033:38-319(+)